MDTVLIFQGGGSLRAYECGVYQALTPLASLEGPPPFRNGWDFDRRDQPGHPELVIGVGRPVFDMFVYSGISPTGVVITSGDSAPRGRPVRKPGFPGEVSAKQVRNPSRFRPPQTPTPGPLPYSARTSRLIEDRSRRDCAVSG